MFVDLFITYICCGSNDVTHRDRVALDRTLRDGKKSPRTGQGGGVLCGRAENDSRADGLAKSCEEDCPRGAFTELFKSNEQVDK